jgi:dipeptidyl aminopeptidase/acylaminoacyl peptidase
MVEAPRINEVRISATGSHVAYSLSRASVTANSYVTELLLQELDEQGRPRNDAIRLEARSGTPSAATFNPQWVPGRSELTFFRTAGSDQSPELVRYVVGSKSFSRIPLHDASPTTGAIEGAARPRISRVGTDYRWSPDARFVAFTAPLAPRRPLDARQGTHVGSRWTQGDAEGPPRSLFVLDVSSGNLQQLTSDASHVQRFDWSPESHALVVAVSSDADADPSPRTDLEIVDRATGGVRRLVTQPGMDTNPAWSPDGRWIAFASQFGVPSVNAGWPAVVSAAGGPVIRLAGEDDPKLSAYAPIVWAADSARFFYVSSYRLSPRLVEATVKTRGATPVTASDDLYEDRYSFSADRKWLSFTRESPVTPPDLYVRAFPSGNAHAVTNVGAGFPLSSRLCARIVRWPSRDGRFTISGLLVAPRSACGPERPAEPLPALVFINGGPSMVRAGFATDGYAGAIAALAARGYAVLVPNTRGRGGYGEAFERGMRDGRSAGRLPYEDVDTGVDWLVKEGIADPTRLGVFGHSYGGYLTAYTTTQTDRFKAAVVYEAHVVEWLTEGLTAAPNTDWALLGRDLYGFTNVFDPVERARLIAESPALNADRVSTPTLLLFGAHSRAREAGRPLYNALRRFSVPTEFVVYDEGHVFSRPAAMADALDRTAAWFDYWVRGLPYPDSERAREYAAWSLSGRARDRSR